MSAKLPGLQTAPTGNAALDRWIAAVTERLEVREGARGDPLEAVVTKRLLREYSLSDVTTFLSTSGEGFLKRTPSGAFTYVSASDLSSTLVGTSAFQSLSGADQALVDSMPERVRLLVANGIADVESARQAEFDLLRNQIVAGIAGSSSSAGQVWINVKDAPFNAIGDGVADDTAAIQVAIDSAQIAGAVGGVVYLPAGKYKVTSALSMTWPNSSTSFDGASKVVLRGAGAQLAAILDYRTDVTAGGCVSYDFSASGVWGIDSHYLMTWTGGFSIIRSVNFTDVAGGAYTTMGTGVGLYANLVPAGVYQDLVITGYETNIKFVDCLGFAIRDAYLNACNIGISLSMSTFSEPTAVEIENVIVSATKAWGIKSIGGGPLAIIGGTFQSCGYMGSVSGAIYYQNSGPIALPKGLTVDNGYFENNRGSADIYLDTPSGATVSIANAVTNCMFARNDSVSYTTNNILVNAVGTTAMDLLVQGCGFRAYNTYSPNAARLCVAESGTTTNIRTTYITNRFYDAADTPAGAARSVKLPANGLTVGGAYIDNSTGGWLSLNGVAEVVPNGGVAPTTTEYYKLGTTSLRWGEVITKDLNVSGNVTFGASAYITGSGSNLNLLGEVFVAPAVGMAPSVTDVKQLGAPTFRWGSTYTKNIDVSTALTYGSVAIAVPPGGTTAFLRGDGTWVAPAGGAGTVTSVTGTAPVSVATGTTTPVISMLSATSSRNGYLTSADWNTFNNKTSNTGTVTSVSGAGGLSGSVTTSGSLSINTATALTWSVAQTFSAGFVAGTYTFAVSGGNLNCGSAVILVPGASGGIVAYGNGGQYCGGPSNRWAAVYAVNTTIQTSDRRLKVDIADEVLGLNFVNMLRPVSYKWGEKFKSSNPETMHGLVAQEVRQVLDGLNVESFSGWQLDDKNDPDSSQSLSYTEFIAPIIKAVQELSSQNQALMGRVAALERGASRADRGSNDQGRS